MTGEHYQHDIEAEEAIRHHVEQNGYYLGLLEPEDFLPGFAFSIGLYKNYGHPEIICFGLTVDNMAEILTGICETVKKGATYVPDKSYDDILADHDVRFLRADKSYYADYVGYACWYYEGHEFPLLQLVWPDRDRKFPWEDGFDAELKFNQPLLDRNTDFKFYEERNLGVYTSKQVLDGNPILYVYHDANGDWQFHTDSPIDVDDARVVCMEEITRLDPTVNDLYDLPYGCFSCRSSRDSEWEYDEIADEDE